MIKMEEDQPLATQLKSQLSSTHGRRDEILNIQLAKIIADEKDQDSVQCLFQMLESEKKAIKQDVIKVIYEIGEREPELIKTHIEQLVGLLSSTINRLQWGSMIALNTLVGVADEALYQHLPQIVKAYEKGSVITKDHAMKTLVRLARREVYREDVWVILLELLYQAPINQLPSYLEWISEIAIDDRRDLIELAQNRLPELDRYPAKERRVLKVIKNITN